MDDPRTTDRVEREVLRARYGVSLKIALGTLALGLVLLLVGELTAARTDNLVGHMALLVARVGLVLAAVSIPLGFVSWFGRETTRHAGVREGRLPSRYRTVAWLLVLIAMVFFSWALWFTMSRGLGTW